jgi:hypothetical protein
MAAGLMPQQQEKKPDGAPIAGFGERVGNLLPIEAGLRIRIGGWEAECDAFSSAGYAWHIVC